MKITCIPDDDLLGKLDQASVEPKGPTVFIRRRKKCVCVGMWNCLSVGPSVFNCVCLCVPECLKGVSSEFQNFCLCFCLNERVCDAGL